MLKIYITDLAAYNNGYLVGEWVSLPINEEDLSLKIKDILEAGSKACGFGETHEEYFITDYEFETEFKLFEVEEYSNPYTLNEELEKFVALEDYDLKRVSFLLDQNLVCNIDEALERYDDVIIYENMSLKDVVEEYIEETIDLSNIPEIIRNNIDYESIASDFDISGEFWEIDRDVYNYVG